jgi:hypothetical protein
MTQTKQEALNARRAAENGYEQAWERYNTQAQKVEVLREQLRKAEDKRDTLFRIATEQAAYVDSVVRTLGFTFDAGELESGIAR